MIDGIEQSYTPGFHFTAVAEVARRWDITVMEANTFLESIGYFGWSVDTETAQNGGRDE